jgi:predicted RNase H-like HicB family nuclease
MSISSTQTPKNPRAKIRFMQRAHFIVEQHPDGFIAYPLGVRGVVIGQGDTRADALEDARSALEFHSETFGADVLEPQAGALNAFEEA